MARAIVKISPDKREREVIRESGCGDFLFNDKKMDLTNYTNI